MSKEDIIKGYEWSYDADHYNIKFNGSITELLYRNSKVITDYEVIKGTMDDVFLNLTGREIGA